MGVRGSGGVGGGVVRAPSPAAYYVAVAGISTLLLLLLLYFFYFFVRKVKKLSAVETPQPSASAACRPAAAATYPVQPVVRESASEMAKLCKQMPPPGKGDTVFPTSTSPAAVRTDTGRLAHRDPAAPGSVLPPPTAAPDLPAAPDPVLKSAPPVIVTAATDATIAQ